LRAAPPTLLGTGMRGRYILPGIRPPVGPIRRRSGRQQLRRVRMNDKEIEEKVISIVAEQMGVDKGEINRDTNFVNDLNADSLDTVELVMEFEDEFETSIPDEQAEKIQTVGQAIDFIKEHMQKTGKA
jgi:acyl carrier protein